MKIFNTNSLYENPQFDISKCYCEILKTMYLTAFYVFFYIILFFIKFFI